MHKSDKNVKYFSLFLKKDEFYLYHIVIFTVFLNKDEFYLPNIS